MHERDFALEEQLLNTADRPHSAELLLSYSRAATRRSASSLSKELESFSFQGTTHDAGDVQEGPGKYVVGDNPVVVFVHQFSLMGGNSSLMWGMARLVAKVGIPAVTFDLRGVNSSSGWRTLTGHKETQDAVAACSWCVKQLQASNIVVVGSSAGAPIGGSAIDQLPQIRGFVGIGYVFGWITSVLFGGHYKNILKSKKPKLFIHGGGDGFTSNATFESYFNQAEEPKEKRIIERVGHFEMEGPPFDDYMSNEILDFVDRYIPPPAEPDADQE
ncbi:hypothetical protein Efla_005540 [Eimeria flavescens]